MSLSKEKEARGTGGFCFVCFKCVFNIGVSLIIDARKEERRLMQYTRTLWKTLTLGYVYTINQLQRMESAQSYFTMLIGRRKK